MKYIHNTFRVFLIIIFINTTGINVSASDYEGIKITNIKRSSVASNGQRIEYLKTDKPEVTVVVVEIPYKGETGWHFHPVPVYAYVLSGYITVEMDNGEQYTFNEGDSIIEVINTPHNGRNTGKVAVKLVVFYAGEQGSPTTVKVEPKKR